MNRQALIEEKKAQIQEQLTRWAKKTLGLQVGEQLLFDVTLATYPVVAQSASEASKLLAIPLEIYFSRERVVGAGVSPTHFVRLYNCVMNVSWRHHPDNNIRTVGDLVAYGKQRFGRTRNAGQMTVKNVETVLGRDGIPFN